MRAYFIAVLLGTILAFNFGCSQESPEAVTQEQELETIPAMPETTIDVKPVSSSKASAPRVLMREGKTYYFQKTIEQRLTGGAESATNPVSEEIELLIALHVLKALPGHYEIDVEFQSVRYHSQLGGRKIIYDSRDQIVAPPEALPYQGLVGNGFQFVLTRDNQITRIEGYAEFLQNCVSEYSPESKQQFLNASGAHEHRPQKLVSAAMNFLDESIALLPFGELETQGNPFPVDSKWQKTFLKAQPVPVQELLNARIEHVSGDGKTAHVVIQGDLKPIHSQGTMTEDAVRTRFLGGTVTGSCSLSLTTGLPQSCRIQRDMEIEMASLNHPTVTARKTVITSLEAWEPTFPASISRP
ncbi:MAG: hypothetical protein HUJ26_02930 [Planctomycetaceae bacterium]|nr:hypothetical protein [Planctomycetaceae bacterium]